MRKLSEQGQALLLVLLSMAVILTIVLSIVARSVTDINVTSREESALRAFSAAEAGVEKALLIGSGVSGPIGDASFNAQVTGANVLVTEFAYPAGLSSGESLVTWFVNHDSTGASLCSASLPCFTGPKFKVLWGKPGNPISSTTPAIEITVFYTSTPGNYATTKVARDTGDPYSDRRTIGVGGAQPNKFSAPDAVACPCSAGGESFAFQKTVDFTALGIPSTVYNVAAGLQFAKIRVLYNTDATSDVGISQTGVTGASLFPPQGLIVDSTGTSGNANRKVEVFQGYGEAPSIFDGALYSPGGITK